MNSIKNAIVTVTLLAVGYGSYVVLSEPEAGVAFTDPKTAQVSPTAGDALPALEIDQLDAPGQTLPAATPFESTNDFPPSTSSAESTTSAPQQLSEPDFTNRFPAQTANPETLARLEPPTLNVRAPVTFNAPKPQGLPDLPPLPDLIGSSEPDPLPLPNTTEAAPFPELVVDEKPFDPSPTRAEPVASRFEPAVAGPTSTTNSSIPLVPPGFQSDLGKAPPRLVAPTEIDVAPLEPVETVTAILPPIDPSLGPIPPAPDEGSVAFEKAWADVQELVRNNDITKALRTLTPWSADANLRGEQHDRCFRMLDELAGGVIYSRTSYLEPSYTVRAGETLEEIAATYGVPQELLARINGVTAPYALSTGESLKVVRGPFRAEVSIANQRLTLYAGAYYAGRFQVAIGQDLPPEEAFYEVAEKSQGRNYFDRKIGSEVLRGQDNNRYGGHWMGLRGEHITSGHSVGIHGRAKQFKPDEVGCISLDSIDASDVFSILSIGSRVQIRR